MVALGDLQKRNLLIITARLGHTKIVKFLIIAGFDLNYGINGKIAADFAYEEKHFETLLLLMNENSKFPVNYKYDQNHPEDFKAFVAMTRRMHANILSKNKNVIKQIIAENPNFRHFYDENNNSAVVVTIKRKLFEIYELLISKNIFFGPHEVLDDLLDDLSNSERGQLRELHVTNSQSVTESHILTLMVHSNVGPDDTENRLNHVLKAYQCLNKSRQTKILLQLAAALKNFQLIYDFNNEHVQYIDPTQEPYTNGLFYLNGRIFIGAKLLLMDLTAHEVYGVIAHEICHFVMFHVYQNEAKPYKKRDLKHMRKFQDVLEKCKIYQDEEEIVDLVYECYLESQQHAELIVRVPHMIAHYHKNRTKLDENREKFPEAFDYYDEICMSDMEEKLRKIEGSRIKPCVYTATIIILVLLMIGAIGIWVGISMSAPISYTSHATKAEKPLLTNSEPTIKYSTSTIESTTMEKIHQHIPSIPESNFSWIIGIFDVKGTFLCSGVIIHRKYILTGIKSYT